MHRTTSAHPSWCDPRCCRTTKYDDLWHSSVPVAWQPSCDDVRIELSLTRLDDRGECPHIGTTSIWLRLHDLVSDRNGAPIEAESWLDAPSARMLAAELVGLAEQLEQIEREEANR